MTDANTATPTEPQDDDDARDARHLAELQRIAPAMAHGRMEPDRSLRFLVDLAQNWEGEFPFQVTLVVSGAVVTGRLISDREYFELFSKTIIPEGLTDPSYVATREQIASYGVVSDANRAWLDKREEETGVRPVVAWISLADAQVFQGSEWIPGTGGSLFRIRAAAVDGFTVGRASRTTAE